jgi:M6 family metalloprotease-like protein
MKLCSRFLGLLFSLGKLAYLLALVPQPASAVTLEDFGFEHIQVNGANALSPRPLLVVLADFSTGRPWPHTTNYYDDLYFNLLATNGVSAAFWEMSNNRFYWRRGGVIGPLQFTPPEQAGGGMFTNDTLYVSNIIHRAMSSGRFNFAAQDSDGDGHLVQTELQIIIVANDGYAAGSARWGGTIRPAGSPVDWTGSVGSMSAQTGLATLTHELSHTLGTLDIYGVWSHECLSDRVTLMSCTILPADRPDIWHLDPWHKMQLGWSEPRIRFLRDGGVESLPTSAGGRAGDSLRSGPRHG